MDSTETRRRIVSSDTLRGTPTDRTPPGQQLTSKWPVLHYGPVPKVNPHDEDWSLRFFGLCDEPYELSYQDLLDLPTIDVVCDMHCVTHWSRLNNVFTGVPIAPLIARAKAEAQRAVCVVSQRGGVYHQRTVERVHRGGLHPGISVGGEGVDAGAWLAVARAGAESLSLEKRQMVARHRTSLERRTGILGTKRLPHAR